MKIVLAWLTMIAIAVISCSIKHASEQFECETTADCIELGDDRVCSDGLCVVIGTMPKDASTGDGMRPDAPVDAPPFVCPPQCTSCNAEKKECLVDCQNDPDQTTCSQPIKCPPGFSCNIKCNSPSSCRMGVDCTAGSACRVDCTGFGSCRNVQCGPGECAVTCAGNQSCGGATTNGVSCNNSCACDVKCQPGANCFNITCTAPQCDIPFDGCSSEPQGCDTCQ